MSDDFERLAALLREAADVIQVSGVVSATTANGTSDGRQLAQRCLDEARRCELIASASKRPRQRRASEMAKEPQA